MAIEIEHKTELNKIFWPIAFLIFCMVILMALIVSYFYFDSAYKDLLVKFTEKQKGLVRTAEEKALEDSLTGYQKKIDLFDKIFKEHRDVLSVFSFVEKTCHPSVYFSDIKYDIKTGEAAFSGTAADFMTVSQQVMIFKEQKDVVRKVALSNLAPKESGEVGFSLSLSIDPNITLVETQK